jgi:CheY-like chemotaxis protein
VLLAEDECIVRELARMILERAGYRVLEAADGVSALDLWSEHRGEVDVLVTDMVMPNGVTGRELSKRLLADDPNLAVVYASGYSLELTAPDFRQSERQMFLQKPYLTDQLVSTVQRCLRPRDVTVPA